MKVVVTLPNELEMTLPVQKEGEFLVLRFTDESFKDVMSVFKNQGLDIKIEE